MDTGCIFAIVNTNVLLRLFREMALQPTDAHLNSVDILHKLEDVLPDNSIIVADGGDFVGTAAYILRFDFIP